MPAERFYIPTPFKENLEVILEGQEFHHLAHVMRLEEGEQAELVNGEGSLAHAKLIKRDKKKALFLIETVSTEPKPVKKIILAQALPRINRLDTIIEKATELGATHIWLFPGQLSERKSLTEHQVERLQGLAVSAMKQCGRLYLPELKILPALDKWEKTEVPSYFGDVRATAPLFLDAYHRKESTLFFIGSEAGFNDKEVTQLESLGAKGVKLHGNILRTDTAAIIALSLISHG
jgi:16S rRNA (uracil1498-N3)-methyltransferase